MPHSQVILLVDDDKDDRFLLRRSFATAGIPNPLYEVTGGAKAIAYLAGEGQYSDRNLFPLPGIILLDLNMPGVDGFDVLQWIRSKMPVQGLLIIVLSRVEHIREVNRAYALGANSFLTKPGPEKELDGIIASFRDYWILQNRPPTLNSGN